MAKNQAVNKFSYQPLTTQRAMQRYGTELLKLKPEFKDELIKLNKVALMLWGDLLNEKPDGRLRRASLRGRKGASTLLIIGADGEGKYTQEQVGTNETRFLEITEVTGNQRQLRVSNESDMKMLSDFETLRNRFNELVDRYYLVTNWLKLMTAWAICGDGRFSIHYSHRLSISTGGLAGRFEYIDPNGNRHCDFFGFTVFDNWPGYKEETWRMFADRCLDRWFSKGLPDDERRKLAERVRPLIEQDHRTEFDKQMARYQKEVTAELKVQGYKAMRGRPLALDHVRYLVEYNLGTESQKRIAVINDIAPPDLHRSFKKYATLRLPVRGK